VLLVHRESIPGKSQSEKPNPFDRTELKKHFNLEPLHSYALGPGETALISRVVDVHLSSDEELSYREKHRELIAALDENKEDLSALYSKWLP